MAVSRRRWKWLLGFLLLAGLAGGGRAWWTDRRYRGAMAEIEAEILAARFGLASRKLETLLAWKPDSDGALVFLLGCCEQSRRKQGGRRGMVAGTARFGLLGTRDLGPNATPPGQRAARRRRTARR